MLDGLFDPLVRKMLRPPHQGPRPLPKDLAGRAEDVTIPGGMLPMRGWLVRPEGQVLGIVLFVHGWGGDAGRAVVYARSASVRGLAVLMVDLPGHGRTGRVESYNARLMVEDIARVGEWIGARDDLRALPAGLLGYSFGGLGCFNAAARDDRWRALVVVAAPLGPLQATKLFLDGRWLPGSLLVRLMKRSIVRVVGVDPDEYDGSRAFPRLRVPVLVVHGDVDGVVPVAHGKGLAGFSPRGLGEFLRVSRADHATILDDPAIGDRVAAFLVDHLVGREAPLEKRS